MAHTIGAGEFKAKCLHLLDEVEERREELIITKHGRPVAKLVPMPPTKSLFGALKGSVVYQDDLISPIDAAWEANS
ncbi:MAG TPA: type II toxin-antitoxin system prevent-host-death family antitoxin [Chloroflexota bacterium]|nr:type II toxin-antitoxin system prevent-host-death family antitoxin [Chloroflexota bacterium]